MGLEYTQPKIYIPNEAGLVDSHTWKLHKALQRYDERLGLGFNEDTRDWCVYYRRDRADPFHPVFGLGKNIADLSVEVLLQKVYHGDALRHGEKILNLIHQNNDEVVKVYHDKSDEVSAETAEYLAWFGNKHNKERAYTRIFIDRGYKPRVDA